ncbi:hypothetical protein GCM10010431_55320 [Streptomyces kunmingensis]
MLPNVWRDPQAERRLQRPRAQAGVAVLGRQDGAQKFDAGLHDAVAVRSLLQSVADGQLGEVGERETQEGYRIPG